MPFNGMGTFVPLAPPNYPAVSGQLIKASEFNAVMQDVFDGLSNCITKDGQTTVTGTINFSNQDIAAVKDLAMGGDLSIAGDVLLTGTGKLIKGVMSGTPRANRMGFQNAASNEPTLLEVLPNNTTTSGYLTYNSQDRDNANLTGLYAQSDKHLLTTLAVGSASPLPLVISLNSVDRLTFGTDGSITFNGDVSLPSTTAIGNVSSTELSYLDGVTSAVQTQLNAKAPLASPTFTGTVVLPSSTSIGNVSSTELGYLDGVTSAIQTQLNAKAPLASPALTGTPTVPTATIGTNTTQAASTAFVQAVVSRNASYTPTVRGSTTAGTATYTTQTGSSYRLGDKVFFDCAVSWSGLTGTGDLWVSLPVAASSFQVFPLNVSTSGLSIGAGNLLMTETVSGSAFARLILVNQTTGARSNLPVQADIWPGFVRLSGWYSS